MVAETGISWNLNLPPTDAVVDPARVKNYPRVINRIVLLSQEHTLPIITFTVNNPRSPEELIREIDRCLDTKIIDAQQTGISINFELLGMHIESFPNRSVRKWLTETLASSTLTLRLRYPKGTRTNLLGDKFTFSGRLSRLNTGIWVMHLE